MKAVPKIDRDRERREPKIKRAKPLRNFISGGILSLE
jgi:hypothetical protein